MAKRRFFISVGSTGMHVLEAFIDRMVQEQLFKVSPYDQYLYIAMDSDANSVQRYENIDLRLSSNGRIIGIAMESYTGGVGGDRVLSLNDRSCIDNLVTAISHKIISLQPDDEFFVIGSAAGGTSSGLFLNVCEKINYWIKQSADKSSECRKIIVRAFLMLPSQNIAPVEMANGVYPTFPNMINLFQDIQCASWRRMLENEWRGFTVPIPTVEDSQYVMLNDFSDVFPPTDSVRTNCFGTANSTLPWTTLHPVPILNDDIAQTIQHMAELLMLYGVITIDKGHTAAVDRFGSVRREKYSQDDCPFTGTTFVAYKSGYFPSLQKWFKNELQSAYARLAKNKENQPVERDVKKMLEYICYPGNADDWANLGAEENLKQHIKKIDQILNSDWNSIEDFLKAFAELLKEFKDLDAGIKGYGSLKAEQMIILITRAFQRREDFCLLNFKNAYMSFYDDRRNLETELNQEQGILEQLGRKTTDDLESALKSRAVSQLDARGLIIKAYFNDFTSEYREHLKNYLRLKRRMLTSMTNTVDMNKAIDAFEDRIKSLADIQNDSRGGNANVISGPVVEIQGENNYQEIRKHLSIRPVEILGDAYYSDANAEITSECDTQIRFRKFMADNQPLPKTVDRDAYEYGAAPEPGKDKPEDLIKLAMSKAIDDFIRKTGPERPDELAHLTDILNGISVKRPEAHNEKAHASIFDANSNWQNRPVPPEGSCGQNAFIIKLGTLPESYDLQSRDLQDIGLTSMPGASVLTDRYPSDRLHGDNPRRMNVITNYLDQNDTHLNDQASADKRNGNSQQLFDSGVAPRTLRGLWIGKFQICYEGSYIMSMFPEASRNQWLRYPVLNNKRCIYTLTEMIKFGLIMLAIRENTEVVWNALTPEDKVNWKQLSLTIKWGDGGNDDTMKLPDAGFNGDNNALKLPRMSKDFEKKVWKKVNDLTFRVALPSSILLLEQDIFTNFRLHITEEEIDGLKQNRDSLKKKIEVTIIPNY